MNILALGAHPDDIELGCFGTLLRHKKQGDDISIGVFTNGEKGGSDTRWYEVLESAKSLDASCDQYSMLDGQLKDDIELVSTIQTLVSARQPDIIYTTSINDMHQDHIALAKATRRGAKKCNEIYSYQVPSTPFDFKPNYFVDITEFWDEKVNAIQKHKSQEGKFYMDVGEVENLGKAMGFKMGRPGKMLECFETVKRII